MEKFDVKIPLRYGILIFTAMMVIGMLMYVFYQSLVSSFLMFALIGIISLALLLFLGIWCGITYRREHGGIISFGHAFLAIYIVFICFSLARPVSMILINKLIDRQYAEKASSLLKEKMTDYFEQHNVPEDKAKEALDKMGPEKFDPPIAEQLKDLAGWLVGLAAVALIAAVFIKRGSADLIGQTQSAGSAI